MQVSTFLEHQSLPINIFKLDSGLTVIHQYLESTPVVAADIWIKAGSIMEPKLWSGMAHFLEHMIFKGSPEVEVGEFDWVIENAGGTANAATSHDYAHFYINTTNTNIAHTLPYLAEIVLRASIPDDEFYRERDVVLEEIRASNDDPDWIGLQLLYQTIYQAHPYKRSILGDIDLLMEQTPDLMRCFHRTYYQPENMTIALVGGIDRNMAVALVEENFQKFCIRSECPSFAIEAEPPLTEVRRQELELPRLEQARLMMGWITPNASNFKQAVGLELLAMIIAGSRCARLVHELREEKGLVLDILSDFALQQDSGLMTITALLETEDLDLVESIICDRLWELGSEPVSDKELARAKRLLISDDTFAKETPSQLASIYGYYNTINCLQDCFAYSRFVTEFSAEELQHLARAYLSPERYASVKLKPL